MSNLRGGMVVTLRINPSDCMGVLDVIEAAGVPTTGMSFAAQASLAFSSLMQTMRDEGKIPTRDGFEYLDMMGPFLNGKNNKRKSAVTAALVGAGAKVKVHGISAPRKEAVAEVNGQWKEPDVEKPLSLEDRENRTRLTELLKKKDMAEDGVEGITWGTGDDIEYNRLVKLVYGE